MLNATLICCLGDTEKRTFMITADTGSFNTLFKETTDALFLLTSKSFKSFLMITVLNSSILQTC